MTLSASDIRDEELVDQAELRANGSASSAYRSGVTVSSTTAATKRVVVTGYDPEGLAVGSRDTPAEVGDLLVLSGTTGGADGTYTIAAVFSGEVQVAEDVPDSTGGTAEFRNPPGASKVGIDTAAHPNSSAETLQEFVDEVATSLAAPGVGAVLYSKDGVTMAPAIPIVARGGWLKNSQGRLLVK